MKHLGFPDLECVPLTISYRLDFHPSSKVWSMLHRRPIGRVKNKECYFLFTYTFFGIFKLVFIKKIVFFFLISIFLFDEVSNFRNRILTNQKQKWVIRNCQWSCMFIQYFWSIVNSPNLIFDSTPNGFLREQFK